MHIFRFITVSRSLLIIGDGVCLYDAEGRKYLDFGAGIAVMALGYNHKRYNDALKGQIDKLIHTSNLFYHEPGAAAGRKLRDASGLQHVFFTNSGTEAVEGALKLAKKHANTNHATLNLIKKKRALCLSQSSRTPLRNSAVAGYTPPSP